MKLRLYLDKDAMDSDLVRALRSRGLAAGRSHWGIVLLQQQRYSIRQ